MPETRPEIACGDYRLALAPGCGGAVARFDWRNQPVFRPMQGSSVLDAGCFALVPFSNRIAGGRFEWDGQLVAMPPNFAAVDPANPLHGFGWLSPWRIAEHAADRVRIEQTYHPGPWPWPYRAEQHFHLNPAGLTVALSLTNLGQTAMPAGLGLHPYFPRTAATRYRSLHRAAWQTDRAGLPQALDERAGPVDWCDGHPVGARPIDTVFAGRSGALQIVWPERAMQLSIAPSANLDHTALYVPDGADWFCIEPVSHATDALNRAGAPGIVALAPGASLAATVRFRVTPLA